MDIKSLTENVKDYFGSYDIELPEDFSVISIAEELGIKKPELVAIMLCNLEATDVMQEIADGDYSNFDPGAPHIFNDGYRDLMSDMMSL